MGGRGWQSLERKREGRAPRKADHSGDTESCISDVAVVFPVPWNSLKGRRVVKSLIWKGPLLCTRWHLCLNLLMDVSLYVCPLKQ